MKATVDSTCVWLLLGVIAVLLPSIVYGRAVNADLLAQEGDLANEANESELSEREALQIIRLIDTYIDSMKHQKDRRMNAASLWGRPMDTLSSGLSGFGGWTGKRVAQKRSADLMDVEDDMEKRAFENVLNEALKDKRFGRVMDPLSGGMRGHSMVGKRR